MAQSGSRFACTSPNACALLPLPAIAAVWQAASDMLREGEAAAGTVFAEGPVVACGEGAHCHTHPFEHWTQGDNYRMANLFARIGKKSAPATCRDLPPRRDGQQQEQREGTARSGEHLQAA